MCSRDRASLICSSVQPGPCSPSPAFKKSCSGKIERNEQKRLLMTEQHHAQMTSLSVRDHMARACAGRCALREAIGTSAPVDAPTEAERTDETFPFFPLPYEH